MSGGQIELIDLTKVFDEVAVDCVNLQVASGEFFSLLGPSGCGKTTTLRLIAGFEQPTSGTVLLDGQDVSTVAPNKRQVNTVFQSYALFPFLTVHENVAFGLRNAKADKGAIRTKVNEMLELVGLTAFEKRRPGQLSGGQQQRVALARALVIDPAVLLLDEPLGALDAKLRRSLKVQLKELQERVGITFLYVTHDQEEAMTMSDRLAVMRAGKIVQLGGPHEIYDEAGRHLRGGLPGRLEPDGRAGGRARPGDGMQGAAWRVRAFGRFRRAGRSGSSPCRDPPRAGSDRRVQLARSQSSPWDGGKIGVPRVYHPDLDPAGSWSPDSGARAERRQRR